LGHSVLMITISTSVYEMRQMTMLPVRLSLSLSVQSIDVTALTRPYVNDLTFLV